MTEQEDGRDAMEARLDEALEESFPASDPIAVTTAVEPAAPQAEGRGRFQVRDELRPKDLAGVSDRQIAEHWSVYEGHVAQTNALDEDISALSRGKDFGPRFSELIRRRAFEYDGMILHEHYFGILAAGRPGLDAKSELSSLMEESFGGYRGWLDEFAAMGVMRGPGWVILFHDPRTRTLRNHWIGMNEIGLPAGCAPILVMDAWEHAYIADSGTGGRASGVKAFLANIDWPKAERILDEARRAEGPAKAAFVR